MAGIFHIYMKNSEVSEGKEFGDSSNFLTTNMKLTDTDILCVIYTYMFNQTFHNNVQLKG